MKNLYNETEAKDIINAYPEIPCELALRIYTSRLIGEEPDLVLHGGGNTSVKLKMKNLLGDEVDILFVKGSGKDLSNIEPKDFTGLDLNFIQRLRNLESLTDEEMENHLLIHKTDASAPDPSVEALLHAFLPHKFIDHTHSDSILVLTNQKDGANLIKQALGLKVAVLPYVKSGLPLARNVIEAYESNTDIEAIIILNHGIFTFGDDEKTSYTRMIDYINRAQSFIARHSPDANKPEGTPFAFHHEIKIPDSTAARVAQTIRGVCSHMGSAGKIRRLYTEVRRTPDLVCASLSEKAHEICLTGVLTPDHVIRTKNRFVYIDDIPENDEALKKIVAQSVDIYQKDYDTYYSNQVKEKNIAPEKLDPYPRVFLVKGLGIIALGFTRNAAMIAADIAEHCIRAKLLAESLGEYVPIPESHIFDMEYWSFQQKKVAQHAVPPLEGQVALVTGAGGAIGYGIAERLLSAGAVVVICDICADHLKKVYDILAEKYDKKQIEFFLFDITDYSAVQNAFQEISCRVGGIDILISNAGVAHVAKIEDLDANKFNQIISVNLMGTFNVIKAAIPIFKRQGTGGNIIMISSKNVFDPGAAFGAYSVSKAAAHQLSKIAALELAEFGVRVNMINPDAVFGSKDVSSKLWDLIGPDRMKSRGLDPEGLREYYRQRNLLKISVQPEHVGNIVVFLASDESPTTGATFPVDGGVPAAFPR